MSWRARLEASRCTATTFACPYPKALDPLDPCEADVTAYVDPEDNITDIEGRCRHARAMGKLVDRGDLLKKTALESADSDAYQRFLADKAARDKREAS